MSSDEPCAEASNAPEGGDDAVNGAPACREAAAGSEDQGVAALARLEAAKPERQALVRTRHPLSLPVTLLTFLVVMHFGVAFAVEAEYRALYRMANIDESPLRVWVAWWSDFTRRFFVVPMLGLFMLTLVGVLVKRRWCRALVWLSAGALFGNFLASVYALIAG